MNVQDGSNLRLSTSRRPRFRHPQDGELLYAEHGFPVLVRCPICTPGKTRNGWGGHMTADRRSFTGAATTTSAGVDGSAWEGRRPGAQQPGNRVAKFQFACWRLVMVLVDHRVSARPIIPPAW